jgi:hypothetical protein
MTSIGLAHLTNFQTTNKAIHWGWMVAKEKSNKITIMILNHKDWVPQNLPLTQQYICIIVTFPRASHPIANINANAPLLQLTWTFTHNNHMHTQPRQSTCQTHIHIPIPKNPPRKTQYQYPNLQPHNHYSTPRKSTHPTNGQTPLEQHTQLTPTSLQRHPCHKTSIL